MFWWKDKPFRQVQNNLRDIDGAMDVDYEVTMLKELGANVVQVGCGGISAFSPTKLSCQIPTPYLVGDKFGEIVEKCHANGIRVIARFDISKANKKYLETNPEWFSRTIDGQPVMFEDCASVCVNGDYQQNRMVEIVSEILHNYTIDGVFFNIPGYATFDYNNKYVGICQCDNCKRRFREWSGGLTLPTQEQPDDPVFRKYEAFKTYTVSDLLAKIRRTIKQINPEVALSTYSDEGIDIVRNEAQSSLDDVGRFWLYSASDDAASVGYTFPDKVSSNVAINAVDIPVRFMGVSTYLNEARLYQEMAVGSNLDWCIVGSFQDYPDRANFQGVERAFHLHAAHEDLFAKLKSAAKVLLVQPRPFYQFSVTSGWNAKEYRGLASMLKEEHIPFDPVIYSGIDNVADQLDEYDVIILPDLPRRPTEKFRQGLLKTTATVVATGCTFQEDPALLQELFGIQLVGQIMPIRSTYVATEPKEIFRSFPLRDWVYLDKIANRITLEDAQGFLPLIGYAPYGPPERAFGHKRTGDSMAAVKGKKNIYLPWQIGTLYDTQGYEDFKYIFIDLLNNIRPLQRPFITDAPSCAEMIYRLVDEKTCLLQIINLSGYNGKTMVRPLPLENIHASFPGRVIARVERLTQDGLEMQDFSNSNTMMLRCPEIYSGYKITFK